MEIMTCNADFELQFEIWVKSKREKQVESSTRMKQQIQFIIIIFFFDFAIFYRFYLSCFSRMMNNVMSFMQ